MLTSLPLPFARWDGMPLCQVLCIAGPPMTSRDLGVTSVGQIRIYQPDVLADFADVDKVHLIRNAQGRRTWVHRALANRTRGRTGLTTAEREELAQLRKENRQLRLEREILKNAAAFFAKEPATRSR